MKKFLLSLACAIASVGIVAAEDSTYTIDFSATPSGQKDALATTIGSKISGKSSFELKNSEIAGLSGADWTYTNATTTASTVSKDSSGRGLQIGTSKATPSTVTFATDFFNGKSIKSITCAIGGNAGTFTYTINGSAVANKTSYSASSSTNTIDASWTATTPVACVSGLSISINAGSGKALFFKSITIVYEESSTIDPITTLGAIKVNGKEVKDEEEITVKVGETVTFSAENATMITFDAVDENDSTNTADGGEEASEVSWTITVSGKYMVNVDAASNEEEDSKIFYVIATEPATKIDTFVWTPESVTITQDDEYELPTFICSVDGLTINYASSNPAVATVENGIITLGTSTGEATITASFDGNEEYEEAVATCKIIVKKLGVKVPSHTGMWQIISKADDIIDGEIYALIGKDSNGHYAMSTNFSTTASSYINKENITLDNNVFTSDAATAFVVINKVDDGYTLYLTNGVKGETDQIGFLTCSGLTQTKSNKNNITVSEEASKSSTATLTFDNNDSSVEVKFLSSTESTTESTRVYLCYNTSNKAFSCYDKSTNGMNPIFIYGVHTPAPKHEAGSTDGEFIITAANEQYNIWYRINRAKASMPGMRFTNENSPFVSADSHTLTISLEEGETADYYSEYLGRKSAQMNLDYSGNVSTTGIAELTAEKAAVIYDLQGRKVSKAGKGLYIQGGKVVRL